MPEVKYRCTKCGEYKPQSQYYFSKTWGKHYRSCKKCHGILNNAAIKKKGDNDPRYRLWLSSYIGAKTRGLEHTISPSDIPTPRACPLLGMVLSYKRGTKSGKHRVALNAATIDRIDNSRGYTPDNIQVISWRANRTKSNMTPAELVRLAHGILAMFPEYDVSD